MCGCRHPGRRTRRRTAPRQHCAAACRNRAQVRAGRRAYRHAMTRVAVIGSTSWGTTLAVLLARNGADVTLCARTPEEATALQTRRESPRRPGLIFPASLNASADVAAVSQAELVVFGVTSSSLRANLERVASHISGAATVLSAVKGVEPETGLRMSEIIASEGVDDARLVALSGPNFAGEIASGLPA